MPRVNQIMARLQALIARIRLRASAAYVTADRRGSQPDESAAASAKAESPSAPTAGCPSAPKTSPAENTTRSSTRPASRREAANEPPPSQKARGQSRRPRISVGQAGQSAIVDSTGDEITQTRRLLGSNGRLRAYSRRLRHAAIQTGPSADRCRPACWARAMFSWRDATMRTGCRTAPMSRTVSVGSSARASFPPPTRTASWYSAHCVHCASCLGPGDPAAFAGRRRDTSVQSGGKFQGQTVGAHCDAERSETQRCDLGPRIAPTSRFHTAIPASCSLRIPSPPPGIGIAQCRQRPAPRLL